MKFLIKNNKDRNYEITERVSTIVAISRHTEIMLQPIQDTISYLDFEFLAQKETSTCI